MSDESKKIQEQGPPPMTEMPEGAEFQSMAELENEITKAHLVMRHRSADEDGTGE